MPVQTRSKWRALCADAYKKQLENYEPPCAKIEADEAEKDRAARITEAEIRSAGFGASSDINQNQQSDYLDAMSDIRKDQQYQDSMSFKREQQVHKNSTEQQKMGIEREKLQTQQQIAEKQLQIARENKNKYDAKAADNKKEK